MTNLTPEEREAGKEGARAAGGQSRRDFLKQGILAGAVAGGGLGAFYFGYEKTLADPVRVGVLGTGDEGNVLIGAVNPDFIQVKAIADIRPYNQWRAFNGEWGQPARPGLLAKYGWKTEDEARKHVKVYEDYNELLEKEQDIEAVIIALPLHLHAPAAIAAMKRGLHVMTEKLMAHSVHECKDMARTAAQTGLYLATGHQRHYNILYHEAVDAIRRGLLGDLHYIRAQWHRGNQPGHDSWQMPLPPRIKDPKKYKDADKLQKEWDSWTKRLAKLEEEFRKKGKGSLEEIQSWRRRIAQKEAQIADGRIKDKVKDYGYKDAQLKQPGSDEVYDRPAIEELIRWRLWERTGGGLMAELGSHQLDAASIFISALFDGEKQHPLNVVCAANRPVFPMDREIEDHVCCILEFPAPGYVKDDPIHGRKKIGVQYASINGNGYGGYGEIVFGTKRTLVIEKEQTSTFFPGLSKMGASKGGGPTLDTQASGVAVKGESGPARDISRGYVEELEHWAWCIRNPSPFNQPRCYPKVALGDAVIALTTNIAGRQGKRIEFQEAWFDPNSDETPEGIKPSVPAKK